MLLHTAAQHPRLVQQVGYHQHAPATTLKFKSDAYTHPSTPPSTDGRDVKGASSGWYSRGFAGHVKGLQWQCWSVLLPWRHLPVQHQVHSTTLCSTPSPSVRTQDIHIKILNHCCLSEHQPSLGCHWKYPVTGWTSQMLSKHARRVYESKCRGNLLRSGLNEQGNLFQSPLL